MKGQVGFVMTTIVLVILTGVLLKAFSPTIEEFRVERLSTIDNYPNENNDLTKILLYAFMPIMWSFYIFLSAIVIFISVRRAQGSMI
jgi:hypothetical protein